MNEVYLLKLIWDVHLHISINANKRRIDMFIYVFGPNFRYSNISSSCFSRLDNASTCASSNLCILRVLTVSNGRVLEWLLWQSHFILCWSYACCYQPLSLILWCTQFMLHLCNYVFLPSMGKFIHAPDFDQYKDLVISFFPTRGCWNCFMAL